MDDPPLAIRSFPRAIVHIDGDAFFASCEQAKQTASEHYLPLWGMKPTVLEQRNLLDLHKLILTHEGLFTRRHAALAAS